MTAIEERPQAKNREATEAAAVDALPTSAHVVTAMGRLIVRRNNRRANREGETIRIRNDLSTGVQISMVMAGSTAHEEPKLLHYSGSKLEQETYADLFLLGALVVAAALRQGVAPDELPVEREEELEAASRHIVARHFNDNRDRLTNGSLPASTEGSIALTQLDLDVLGRLHEGLEERNMDAQFIAQVAYNAAYQYFDAQPKEDT